jgi:dihydroorotate dehydrogenase
MYGLLRRVMFQMEPEQAHAAALASLRLAWSIAPVRAFVNGIFSSDPGEVEAFGLRFRGRVGLAAGYDKDGLGWRALSLLGFGHIEVGTVTPQPQAGNPRPRVFRLVEDQALINRMGFPGRGASFVAQRLKGPRPEGLVLGVNLGKNRQTPLREAHSDYQALVQIFAPLADYLAINVSSPNTEGLRRLQSRQALTELLGTARVELARQEILLGRRTPVLVKLSPDLTNEELDDALDVILQAGMDGVIATNTTTSRPGLVSSHQSETGGLSGDPLTGIAVEMVRKISQRTGGRLPVVGVGGIMNETGAQRMLDAGAVLVQVYTGLIYAGPGLVKRLNRSL